VRYSDKILHIRTADLGLKVHAGAGDRDAHLPLSGADRRCNAVNSVILIIWNRPLHSTRARSSDSVLFDSAHLGRPTGFNSADRGLGLPPCVPEEPRTCTDDSQ